ncbi:ribonuclease inhibitor-like isoform X1 [Pimephales promelas]|uniref:ribonuclease inhibitor-like isoform X1 n=1 Tax=Pimephales promelas TaxID=90988 RepID=UPI0019557C7A|nr:ribonuclease inhibitor-like isoform X1 [Pimephales promelas]
MSEERGKDSLYKMSLSEKQSVRSGSHVSSSVSVKSDCSKDEGPIFSERKPSTNKRLQRETLDSDVQTHRNNSSFNDNLLGIFQDIESKMIIFLKNELEMFKKILQNGNTQPIVKAFNENRCSIKAAALDLTLHYLREMEQDEAADALEDELLFIHQLKCSLKKKNQCVFEGIAKQGDSTLLNNIYTDLYITQGGSEQVNTEHEVRQIEVASRRHKSQDIQVECTHLFEAPEQDEEIRTVLSKGVAGIGKSVSVQKFILDWAEGKENQDISFIFPLQFREINLKEKVKLRLNFCGLTDKSCSVLAKILVSDTNLKELNMNNNNLQDSGVKLLCTGMKNTKCKLEILRLSWCCITDEGCSALTSALKSNPSHLRELDLSWNNLGDSGVKNLSDLLMNPQFKLEKLNLYRCSITEKQCLILTSALKSNPSHLRELNLSGNNLGDSGVKNLSDLLMNPQLKLEKLNLYRCSITEKHCLILSSALKSNPSHLRELNLSENIIENSGVKHLCDILKDPPCKLERLRLSCCFMTDEGCSALTSALNSNPSHLRELNLSVNKLGDSGVKNLSDLLMNPQLKLEKLNLYRCGITEKQCLILTSALKSNPSHLRELNLSWNKLGDSGVKHCCDVLKDPHCKLERLSLQDCGITDVSPLTQSLTNSKALKFSELDLRHNNIGDSKQRLRDKLRDSNCGLRVDEDRSPNVPNKSFTPV